jgi:hypothetical protein
MLYALFLTPITIDSIKNKKKYPKTKKEAVNKKYS